MDNSTPGMTELLIRYMDGELDADERAGLEQKLAKDPLLQAELESLRLAREAVRIHGLQQQVGHIHEQMMQEMKSPVRRLNGTRTVLRYTMGVAAAIILVVAGVAGFTFYRLTPERVYESNYQPYELSTLRGSGNDAQLNQEYKNGNYQRVIELANSNPGDSARFLAGMSHLRLKQYPEAITSLKTVLVNQEKSPTPTLKDETEYYLALAYTRNQDYDFAMELVERIKNNPGHTYHEKASNKLLRQLRLLKWK